MRVHDVRIPVLGRFGLLGSRARFLFCLLLAPDSLAALAFEPVCAADWEASGVDLPLLAVDLEALEAALEAALATLAVDLVVFDAALAALAALYAARRAASRAANFASRLLIFFLVVCMAAVGVSVSSSLPGLAEAVGNGVFGASMNDKHTPSNSNLARFGYS